MTAATPPDRAENSGGPPARVGLLIGSLEAGGAQRVALGLARDLLEAGWEVRLLLLNPDREMALPGDAAMQSALEARLVVLGGSSVRAATIAKALWFPRLHRRLARAVAAHRLTIVVSFMERANLLNLLGARSVPRVISVRKQISVALADKPAFKRWLIVNAYPRLLRRAAAIVLNAEASAVDFARRFAVARTQLTVIPNPVDRAIVQQAKVPPVGPAADLLGPNTVVSVGRLVGAKGQVPLLRAFARTVQSAPQARLVIVGDGPLRDHLSTLAQALGIGARVGFAGFQSNPYPWIAGAGAFALSSRAEGFPNALLEAMALGRACVAADCPSGPRELLAPDTPVDRVAAGIEAAAAGILVPPMPQDDLDAKAPLTPAEHALAEALTRLLRDPDLSQQLRTGALDRAASFTPARWQRVISASVSREP